MKATDSALAWLVRCPTCYAMPGRACWSMHPPHATHELAPHRTHKPRLTVAKRSVR